MRNRNRMISRNTNRRLLRERTMYSTPSLIKRFLTKHEVKNYTINPKTLEVDVDGTVTLYDRRQRTEFIPVQFNIVTGNFNCVNIGLKDLHGVPRRVGGDFWCIDNQLRTLEGAPQYVKGDFRCWLNYLEDLEGSPQKVGGDFHCNDNRLTTLKGAPRNVGGSFICSDNRLINLNYAPDKVGGDFFCGNNRRTFTEADVKYVSAVKGSIILDL